MQINGAQRRSRSSGCVNFRGKNKSFAVDVYFKVPFLFPFFWLIFERLNRFGCFFVGFFFFAVIWIIKSLSLNSKAEFNDNYHHLTIKVERNKMATKILVSGTEYKGGMLECWNVSHYRDGMRAAETEIIVK